MPYPQVVATATWNGNASTHYATMPAGINPGDLLLVFQHGKQTGALNTLDSKWTLVPNSFGDGGVNALRAAYCVADGTETGDVLLSSGAVTDNAGTITFVLRNWIGTPVGATPVQATAITANPPALTTGFGAVATLFFVAAGCGNPLSIPYTVPTNYGNQVSVERASEGVGVCRRELTAASDDPPTLTSGDGVSRAWISHTVAVRGEASIVRSQAIIAG